MNKPFAPNFKKALPYLLIILGFIVIAYGYTPEVLRGKIVNQSDIAGWKGMANEIVTYNEEHPDDPTLWTNSMFGGMPANMISVKYEGDYTDPLYKALFVGARPASYLIISLIGGFLLFLAFGVNVWLSAIGAIAITFCSYNMQIIQIGHNTKMIAIAFMPWVLAAIVYAYRKAPLWGSLLFAFALSFQIKANHPQITYYLAMIVLAFVIATFIVEIKNKALPRFMKTSALLLVAGLLGIATNVNHLWPTYEYQRYSMRGGSELSNDEDIQSGKGLNKEYATAWSYGIEETPNLMIPNFNGGSSWGELSIKSNTYQVLRNYQGATQMIKQMPLYWGPQPFTAGPMYMGAVSVFLFILGLCLFKGATKWWIAGISLVAVLLSWGSHFMFFSDIFFRFAPLYNKFRTVSMILVILQITIPLLGILTFSKILNGDYQKENFKRSLYIAIAVTGGFSLVMALIPSLAGAFVSSYDSGYPNEVARALMEDRMELLRSDAIRSLTFIALTACVVWFAWNKKLKIIPAIALLGILTLTDLWLVDKRYLNSSHFISKSRFENQFDARPVDQLILQDEDPDYRVVDLSVSTFNDASVSFHHKNIGGYSAAKLQRYQDIIDFYLSKELASIGRDINASQATSIDQLEDELKYYPVLSMLNTKYIILGANNAPIQNRYALGNAWFSEEILSAANADEEIALLGEIDPSTTAIISEDSLRESHIINNKPVAPLQEGEYIELVSYAPNRLIYRYKTISDRLALFSEIYYPKGWRAEIDGTEHEILRANYILRAMDLPAGEHEIEFYFKPDSFVKGATISRIGSITLLLLLLGGIGGSLRRRERN